MGGHVEEAPTDVGGAEEDIKTVCAGRRYRDGRTDGWSNDDDDDRLRGRKIDGQPSWMSSSSLAAGQWHHFLYSPLLFF